MSEKRVITDIKEIEHTEIPDADIEADFEYYVAEKMTRELMEAGQITEEEYGRIITESRKVFKPTLAAIMP